MASLLFTLNVSNFAFRTNVKYRIATSKYFKFYGYRIASSIAAIRKRVCCLGAAAEKTTQNRYKKAIHLGPQTSRSETPPQVRGQNGVRRR